MTPTSDASAGFLQHRVGDCIKERYQILEHLGGGSFGSVYRVRDTAVDVLLACKEMHVLNNPATLHDERALALDLFKREALTLATLRHPHIPSAYFEQQDGQWHVCPQCGLDFSGAEFCPHHGAQLLPIHGRYYLMMDFVDGPTLEEMALARLKDWGRPLEEAACLGWTEQIAGALRALHRVGIVHRDVKPENIKVRTSDGSAVLLDFGLTKKANEAGSYGTVRKTGTGRMGTPGYAPPVVHEQSHPEPRSDIHALGMTLYRLLSMRDPQDPADLAEMRSHPPRFFNDALSPATETLIQTAIAPDITQRFASIDDVLSELHALGVHSGPNLSAPPFTFASGARARTPQDLARLLESHASESVNYLFNGMFAGWLRQSGFAAPSSVADSAVKSWPDNPARAVETFRRGLFPSSAPDVLPALQVEPRSLDFGTVESGALRTLTLRLRNVGAGLSWGEITSETETSSLGSAALPGLQFEKLWEGNDVRLKITLDTSHAPVGMHAGKLIFNNAGVTRLEVPLRYTVCALTLRAEPSKLEFGRVLLGQNATQTLRIRRKESNPEGVPRGTIYAGSTLEGLNAPARFEGEAGFEVRIDGARRGATARSFEGALQLDTNGGRVRVPVRYELVLGSGRVLWLIGGGAGVGALGAMIGRALALLFNSSRGIRWLAGPNGDVPSWSGVALGPLVLGALLGIGGAWEFRRRMGPRAFGRRAVDGLLAQWFPLLGGLAGAGLAWLLGFVLPWGVWGPGDWLLWPFAHAAHLENRGPMAAWALAGGICGLMRGSGRVLELKGARWARYGVPMLLALAFLGALLGAILS